VATELGNFLRARRADARLEPLAARGVGHRRLHGLRREEVAALAGISVDYYTRLEQGRESHPSDAVVAALARALRLAPDATEHLHRLRNGGQATSGLAWVDDDDLAVRMSAVVEAVRPNPAYVLDRLSTMVAVNVEGLTLFEGLDQIAPQERNTCRYLMTDPRAPRIFVEWETIARGAVAHLRAANANDLQDPELRELVTELSDESTLFAEWWDAHIVARRRASIQHLRLPGGEVVARRYEVLHVPDAGLRMTLWLP
jgi:transcriptional regulator with XRE-family HTH domain